jgi:hypothetical protein
VSSLDVHAFYLAKRLLSHKAIMMMEFESVHLEMFPIPSAAASLLIPPTIF